MTANDHARQIVQKLWNYCNVLRDDGLSYGDYVEQLTFLKMAHEQTQPPWSRPSVIPEGYDWRVGPALPAVDGIPTRQPRRASTAIVSSGKASGLIDSPRRATRVVA